MGVIQDSHHTLHNVELNHGFVLKSKYLIIATLKCILFVIYA